MGADRADLSFRDRQLLDPGDVGARSFHAQGAHNGIWKFENAAVAVGRVAAPARHGLDTRGSQRFGELADAILLAQHRYRASRLIQLNWLLLH